jgi:hypothetical protein
MTLLLTGRVIGDRLVDRPEVGLQLTAVVELQQQLADVVGALRDALEHRVVLERQDLPRLAFEHERAAGGVANDDRVLVVEVRGQGSGEAQHDLAGVVEQTAGLQWQAAAVLLGDHHLEAVVLEDRHHLLALPRLVVLGAAAVEVDDLAARARTRPIPCPPGEAPSGELRRRRVAMDAQRLLGEHARRAQSQRQVGQRRHRRAGPPQPCRPGDDPVAQRDALLALELVAGLGVDLGDLDPLGADLRADPAPRAVVDREIDRRFIGNPVSLGLGAGVLRSRKQRRHVGDRTCGLTDRALDAVVKRATQHRQLHQVGHTVASCRAGSEAATT